MGFVWIKNGIVVFQDDYDLYLRAMKLQFANPGERGIQEPPHTSVHPMHDGNGIAHDLTQPRKRDKNQKKQKKRKPKRRDSHKDRCEEHWQPSQIVQCFARVFFPLLYIAFNIYYWITLYET